MSNRLGRSGGHTLLAAGASVLALGLTACGSGSSDGAADLVAGKQQFVAKCGACHTLARAETKGVVGPNLDDAFRTALGDGMGRDTVRGTIYDQILHPAKLSQDNPVYMPAKLVEGRDATNVAAYIAAVTGRSGKDTGALATAVKAPGAGKPAVAANGVLEIDADPSGQLAYVTAKASAPSGKLTLESKNAAAVDHNIAIDVDGRTEAGAVVKGGGVSKVELDLKPGTYDYFCTVPGHREGGMVGKLTVK